MFLLCAIVCLESRDKYIAVNLPNLVCIYVVCILKIVVVKDRKVPEL